MYLPSIVVLSLFYFVGRIDCGAELQAVSESGDNLTPLIWGCRPNEKACLFGCCPYSDGVCCILGYKCCPRGKLCVPFSWECIEPASNENALTATEAATVSSTILKCPKGMTDCGNNTCCSGSKATCCEDGKHCCPADYKCGAGKFCVKITGGYITKAVTRVIKKSPFKTCPGGNRFCPMYMSCCLNNNDEWACCANSDFPQIRYGEGECCVTSSGPLCCPNAAPYCSIFGCSE